MKFLPIFLVFVMCFAARGSSQTLQCYECEDCGELTDSLLQSCPKETTPEPPTDAPATESTTDPTDTTVTAGETTVPAAETTVPAGETTVPAAETTIPAADTTTVQPAEAENAPETPVKPEVVLLANGISKAIINNSRLSRTVRSVFRAGPSYLCYSVDKIDGGSQKPQKGCVEVPEDKEACDVLKEMYGETANCQTCQDNKCNSSAALKYSVAMLLVTLVLGVFFK